MTQDLLPPAIRRVRIQQLTIYEISEEELKALEAGSPVSLHLNFAVFLLSVAVSFAIALVTTTFTNDRAFLTFVLVLIVASIIGLFLLILWLKERQSVSSVAACVRNRLVPEGEPVNCAQQGAQPDAPGENAG